ncbi:hypothetical protein IWX49DRAFT_595429 [Phyllosticta citricarpa]|uniref:Uncharacterized protein n=2 Tax=Phyllosticta TaxID=121621 RepID=A0ABR1L467_9PEZI
MKLYRTLLAFLTLVSGTTTTIRWIIYDTKNDPFEMTNLADSTDPALMRVKSRLNALLMVMKSCEAETCRDPWSVLQPNSSQAQISSLDDALDPAYDAYFDAIPQVSIAECVQYQLAANERPFYPMRPSPGSASRIASRRIMRRLWTSWRMRGRCSMTR